MFEQCSCYASDFVDDFGLCEFLLQSSCSELKVLRTCLVVIAERFRSEAEKEPVASATDPCRLDGEYQVFVVLAVEERHKALLTCEALIYEQVFFIVSHRVSEVHGFATPPPALKFVDHPPTVILFVDGIVGAESCCVEVEHDGLVAVS